MLLFVSPAAEVLDLGEHEGRKEAWNRDGDGMRLRYTAPPMATLFLRDKSSV